MSVAKRRRGESTKGQTVSDANPSRCGRIFQGANQPWGEPSRVESSRGRFDHGAIRPAFGRNVRGAKRTVGETSVVQTRCAGVCVGGGGW